MNPGEENGIRLTEFDYQFAEPQLQMLKAAIPYMEPRRQRAVSLFVRLRELGRTMSLFSGGEMTAMGMSFHTPPAGNASPMEILQAVKPYAGVREQKAIEIFEKMQLMLQNMQNQL